MNIQLIADPQYLSFFSEYLRKQDGVKLEGHPDIVFDASFLDPVEKAETLSKLETSALIVTNTLTMSATAARAAAGEEARIIGVPLLPHYFERQTSVEYALPFSSSQSDNSE